MISSSKEIAALNRYKTTKRLPNFTRNCLSYKLRPQQGLIWARITLFNSTNQKELQRAHNILLMHKDFKTIEAHTQLSIDTSHIISIERSDYSFLTKYSGRVCGLNQRSIPFRILENNPEISNGDMQNIKGKIFKIHEILVRLNAYLFDCNLLYTRTFLDLDNTSYPGAADGMVTLGLNNTFLETSTIHELGHLICRFTLNEGKVHGALGNKVSFDREWNNLYSLSLLWDCHDFVKDSEYPNCLRDAGHPGDNFEELFASSILVYFKYPDEFIQRITRADIKRAKFGKLVWLFIRDRIFSGKTFSSNDPFSHLSFKEEIESISIDEIREALRKTVREKAPDLLYKGKFRRTPAAGIIMEQRRLFFLQEQGHQFYRCFR